MKVSQIVAFGATIISQAEACVRIRVERWVHDGLSTIQDMRLYDNDNAVVTLPYPINFGISSDSNVLNLGGYTVELKYNDDKTNPYGGVVTYPNGYSNDLQGKAYQRSGDHDLYCFSDNYSNCGGYVCGL